jgi:endogenous inhibitor of DNA gyrase (YacG/DUF329 family)
MKRRSYLGSDNPNWRGGTARLCLICQKEFTNEDKSVVFCSKKCYGIHRHVVNTTYTPCKVCGKVIEHPKHEPRIYCSSKCFANDPEMMEQRQSKRRGIMKLSKEARSKISEARSRIDPEKVFTSGKNGHHLSSKAGKIFYRSSYELRAFQLLDDCEDVVTYRVEPFVIRYDDIEGVQRVYRPDILVTWTGSIQTLIEVKPTWKYDDPKFLSKSSAAIRYAREHDMTFAIWNEYHLGIACEVPGFKMVYERLAR